MRAVVPDAAALTTRRLLAELSAALGDANEARWVACAALGVAPSFLATHLSDAVSEVAAESARSMAARRAGGVPLQYVLGGWSFRTLEVAVDPRVLVPRPETEQVVALALEELSRIESGRSENSPMLAADLGTGSGVIALSLVAEGPPGLEVWATDLSADALEVARVNLARLSLVDAGAAGRVHLARGSWFGALPAGLAGRLQLVVSNPPYVSADEWDALDVVVRDHEPHGALVAGARGLECLERIVTEAREWLCPGGSLVVELAPHQADVLQALAGAQGFQEADIRLDLSGRARALVARTGP